MLFRIAFLSLSHEIKPHARYHQGQKGENEKEKSDSFQ